MLLFVTGMLFAVILYSAWELIKEYNLNKFGFIMVVITTSGLFGVLSFIGNAYAEGEPMGAFKAGAAGLLFVLILGIITYKVLTTKKLFSVNKSKSL